MYLATTPAQQDLLSSQHNSLVCISSDKHTNASFYALQYIKHHNTSAGS